MTILYLQLKSRTYEIKHSYDIAVKQETIAITDRIIYNLRQSRIRAQGICLSVTSMIISDEGIVKGYLSEHTEHNFR